MINVYEAPEEGFGRELFKRLADYNADGDVELTVISPDYSGAVPEELGMALLPEGVTAQAKCAVTYGMSGRCSVTLSSIGAGQCVLSLQREIPTAGGGRLERQEIPIPPSDMSGEWTAGLYGALLMAGVEPRQMCICQ